jgi:hypothetical protein
LQFELFATTKEKSDSTMESDFSTLECAISYKFLMFQKIPYREHQFWCAFLVVGVCAILTKFACKFWSPFCRELPLGYGNIPYGACVILCAFPQEITKRWIKYPPLILVGLNFEIKNKSSL